MKKLFLYIRLSDADDDLSSKRESDSITNQRALLYQYIKNHDELQLYEAVELSMTASPAQMTAGRPLSA